MLNNKLDDWKFMANELPEFDKKIYILVEYDVLDKIEIFSRPFVGLARAVHCQNTVGNIAFLLISNNPFDEDENILSQEFTVIAWRYVE